MAEILDGCAEFDERLIEHVFAPSPDAELDRHVASCARCRGARERYLSTADALAGALAAPPEEAAPARSPRSIRRPILLAAVAAAAVLLAIVLVRAGLEPSISVRTIEGEVSRAEGRGAYRIDRGTARFTVERGPLVVETPLGLARCEEGDFTLAVAEEENPMNAKHASLAVTITVAAGVVWWAAGGDEITVEPGASHVERERPEGRGDPAGLGLLETGPIPLGSDQRSPAADGPTPGEIASVAGSAAAGGPDPTFEIFGRVVDAETAQPIAGAVVTLASPRPDGRTFAAHGASGQDGGFRAASSALSRTEAEAIGVNFTLLLVEAEGFAPLRETPWRGGTSDLLATSRPVDLGEIRVWMGAQVSGRVSARGGVPVSDAVVLLAEDVRVSFPGRFSGTHARESARTREDGTFVLARRVAPAKPFGKTFLFAVCPQGLGWTELDVLEAKREIRDVEVEIGAAARLEVLVRGEDRRPIEGAEILAEPRFAPLVLTTGGPAQHDHSMWFCDHDDVRSIFTARTDSSGRARFDRLPVTETGGLYDLVVRAKGYSRSWKDDVRVDPASSASAVVTMETYRPRAVSGTVRAEDGAPIAGVILHVHAGGLSAQAETDALGSYGVEGIDPSVPAAWFVLAVPGFVEFRRSLPLPGQGDLEGFDLVLERPVPIAGRIVDQHGRPVAGARPHLHRENEFRPFRGEQGMTGEDGTFRFDDATRGEWILQVEAPRPEVDWAAAYSNFTVQGGDTSVEIVLPRAESAGARVVGDIVDANGEPLDPTAVALWPVGAWPEGGRKSLPQVARGAGRATAEAVDPGEWRMWARAKGTATAYADFRIEPGQREVFVRVEIRPAGVLTGRVLFDERVPFRPVEIDARLGSAVVPFGPEWSGEGASVGATTVDVRPDGSFRLENATPGRWWLWMRGAGVLGGAFVEVPSGGEGRAEIRPTIGGTIVLRGADVAPDAQIEVEIAEGEEGVWTRAPGPVLHSGRPFVDEVTVWPGRVGWRVGFKARQGSMGRPPADVALPQQGELRIGAGEVAEILVPVVLND